MISGSTVSWAEQSKLSGWPAFLTLHLHVQSACRKSFRICMDEEDQTGFLHDQDHLFFAYGCICIRPSCHSGSAAEGW